MKEDTLLKPFQEVKFIKLYIIQYQNVTDTALYGWVDFPIAIFHFEN